MDYETKAYLTTIIATYLVPILLGLGVTYETANAVVGLIVCLLPMVASMLSEMWTSSHLTRPRPESVNNETLPSIESDVLDVSSFGDDGA